MDKLSRSQDSRIVAAGIDAAKTTFAVCGWTARVASSSSVR